jgi:signal transduction histidine kinase
MKESKSFAHKVANNLREPLMSVKGILNLMRIDTERKNLEEYFKLIEMSVDKMSESVHEILSQVEKSRSRMTLEQIEIKNVLEDAIQSLYFMKGIERVTFILSVDNIKFFSDYRSLYIIFSNLISNAVRYRDHSKAAYLKIKASANNEDVEITFEDNGIGIDEAHYEGILMDLKEDIHRENESGLYQTKSLLDKLDGKIDVQSAVGVGTIFTVQIPKLFKRD